MVHLQRASPRLRQCPSHQLKDGIKEQTAWFPAIWPTPRPAARPSSSCLWPCPPLSYTPLTCTHQLLPPQLTEDSSSSQGNVARLEDESQRAVASIQQSIATKKNEVLDLLMHHVTTVKLTK